MDYYKIGQFIQERRKELNLTQKQLGEKLNVTDKAVSKWERGLGCPDVSILGELSSALDVGIGEILNGEYNETLKDNSEFIKKAVDYSKKITEDNIYEKIKKVLYCILIFIVIYISFIGIKQFIYLNIETEVNISDNLKLQYENLTEKISTIKENNYLINNETHIIFLDDLLNYFENNKIISSKINYFETGSFHLAFMWLESGSRLFAELLIKNQPNNSKYYELLCIYENVYITNDILIDVDDNVFYQDMYMYDKIREKDKIDYYFDILESRIVKLNKTLDFVIEVGEKNA